MANYEGDWLWYELATPDPAGSTAFYGAILGWDVAPTGGDHYHIISKDGEGIGGFLNLTAEMQKQGAEPAWLGYLAADDVDAKAAEITAAGGTIRMAPWDIPGFGRAALVADPDGNPFYIMKGAMPGESTAFSKFEPRPGHCAWNELIAKSSDKAIAFYGAQFGWSVDGAMDMGDMGQYRFLKGKDAVFGAVMDEAMGLPTGWVYYFRVPSIPVAIETLTALGGQVLHGPQEIPGGDVIVNALDPQGATFALVGSAT